MKKTFLVGALLALLVGACLPFPSTPAPEPTVDLASTVDAMVRSSVQQTIVAAPASGPI